MKKPAKSKAKYWPTKTLEKIPIMLPPVDWRARHEALRQEITQIKRDDAPARVKMEELDGG